MVCIDWCDAVAFANALSRAEGLTEVYGGVDRCSETDSTSVTWNPAATGYRLPTESEWEYAARAGSALPWGGEDPDLILCAIGNTGDHQLKRLFPNGCVSNVNGVQKACEFAACDDGFLALSPVGDPRFRVNAWGLRDVTGNAWEWTWDWYTKVPTGGTDPGGPAQGDDMTWDYGDGTRDTGSARVIRGGGWDAAPANVRVAYRSRNDPSRRGDDRGFRLSRSNP